MKKFILFSIALLLTISFNAQWTTDTDENTVVANISSEDMQAISRSDGQTYVVFWESSSLELRLQVLNTSGNKMLGNDGVLISNTLPMSTYTVMWSIVVDNEDNLYVGVTATGDSSGYVFKLDVNGNHLWGSYGVSLGSAYLSTILPLESGEVIISWIPGAQALMQKYDASGNAIWTSTQAVISGSSKTAPANMFEMSNGDYILVFHTYNYGIASTLHAQRYDADGEAVWSAPIQLSDRATAYNRNYSALQDGDTVYFGYFASISSRFDSYLQRIDPDGTLPWGINGMDFDTNETVFETETDIAFTTDSAYIWSTCTYSNTSQTEYGEYIQKFNKETGERLLTDNAKEVFSISADHKTHIGELQIVGNKPLFLLSTGTDDGVSPTTLSAVLLDEDGNFFWEEESKPIATFAGNKKRVQFLQPNNGQVVSVFIENKSTDFLIYAQNFTDEGFNISNNEILNVLNNVKLFPNPASSLFNLEHVEGFDITIADTTGRIIKNIKNSSNQVAIDISAQTKGVYYISLTKDSFSITKKLIIQ